MRSQRAQEWGFLAVAGALAALLVVSSVSSYFASRSLTDAVVRGEGELILHGLREWLPRGRPPGADDLAEFLGRWQDQGLRYVAVLGPRQTIHASAGEPSGEAPQPGLRAGAPQWLGGWDVVRIDRDFGPPPPDGEAPPEPPPEQPGKRKDDVKKGPPEGKGIGLDGRPPPRIRLEYEPRLAAALQQRALRDMVVGTAVAAALVIAALVFHRQRRRARATEGELAKRRHLAALGEMSAVLAHEIRNPLASLKGHAQLLEEQLAGEDRKLAKAKRIVEEAVRLEQLTNTLLDFVRVGKIKRAAADPRALARRAAELTGGARVEIADQAAPASFELDSMRVEQALVNLLRNALQVSPPGTPVQLKVAKETGGLLFVVADRGAGVPADLRERIFEPFVSGRTQGTGLGLAVVSRVAELHGGRAEVADRPGGGSEFSLWLPDEPAKGA